MRCRARYGAGLGVAEGPPKHQESPPDSSCLINSLLIEKRRFVPEASLVETLMF